jgi:hypothetical protein
MWMAFQAKRDEAGKPYNPSDKAGTAAVNTKELSLPLVTPDNQLLVTGGYVRYAGNVQV